ncbi:PDZ domain-containing protein [Thermoanaerobacterium sp. DL9XJH110]|uniref:PDZ domain-containing protein n=1 Tax=Thermoanaerobacterium sp. DL9XJH110 TaxID=3386643 RepID=UPI003BB6DC9E
MFPLGKIILLLLQGLPQAVLSPFFWLVILIAWTQYKRTAELELKMFGAMKVKPREKVIYAVLYGTLGGLAGSLVVILVGISISGTGLAYVWPLALLLMLVHPRFICFSYAGGLVSLFSLLTGFPRIDVAGLMALVAALHLVESFLIFFAGYINASPVFIKDDRCGIAGGFSLQEFWPVPIMLLTVVISQAPVGDMIQMPDWWPLIKPPSGILENPRAVFLMIPVVAALGYGDIALTRTPRARCRASAVHLLAFSGILLALSVLASRNTVFAYTAAVFGPAAHELLIITGKRTERRNPPLFAPPPEGVRVLDVVKGSPAEKIGIGPGDVILSVNGQPVNSPEDMRSIMSLYPTYVWMTVKSRFGETKNPEINAYPGGINSIGAILVPKNGQGIYVVTEEAGVFPLLRRFFRK